MFIYIKIKMKKFRSSKLLKPMQPQIKQQCQLRTRIKTLQSQIQMLKKSNLNIFVPFSQQVYAEQTTDYNHIIKQLKIKVNSLQTQLINQKTHINRLQKQKQQIKKQLTQQINQHKQTIIQLQQQNRTLQQSIEQLHQQLSCKKQQCEQLQKSVIEKNVELKFMSEDLHEQKLKNQVLDERIREIRGKISAVDMSFRIYASHEIECICIERKQYNGLKAKIAELEGKLLKLQSQQQREIINLGTKKTDIGEQIVRLKKNIDVQLGVSGNSKHSESFLSIYKGTQDMFTELISQCKRQPYV